NKLLSDVTGKKSVSKLNPGFREIGSSLILIRVLGDVFPIIFIFLSFNSMLLTSPLCISIGDVIFKTGGWKTELIKETIPAATKKTIKTAEKYASLLFVIYKFNF